MITTHSIFTCRPKHTYLLTPLCYPSPPSAQLVNQRDEEILHIAKSIEELAQIFKELAVLVIDQGTVLDRIDFNMEHAIEHAKEGIAQLQKAEESQKSALSFRIILVLVILIGIMIVLFILKHTRSN